ncbi:hypothetical protein [Salinicola sp. CPA57]|uniref:hypothetical protein n=1 Tax=Salinicola sp. CPA57 TaxID=1949080 RepID=UPI000DA24B07|nr:hypothetical protein [Salinicola sp. CPA57]
MLELKELPWQLIISGVGIFAQMAIASGNNKAVDKRAKTELAQREEEFRDLVSREASNYEQRKLESDRAVNAFIADKRQAWIDELRKDVAHYLALSQEIAWRWAAIRSEVNDYRKGLKNELDKGGVSNVDIEDAVESYATRVAKDFVEGNGERDRVHHEILFMIMFRLNPGEKKHQSLRGVLSEIRKNLHELQQEKEHSARRKIMNAVKNGVKKAEEVTEEVLKDEWEKIKIEARAI